METRRTRSFLVESLQADRHLVDGLLVMLDLAGTFVFALSGAMAGIKHRLDLFGILALSFAAATAGGITRNVLIGSVPRSPSTTGGTSSSHCSPVCWPLGGTRPSTECGARCSPSMPLGWDPPRSPAR